MYRLNEAEKAAFFVVKNEPERNHFHLATYQIHQPDLEKLKLRLDEIFKAQTQLRYILIDEADTPLMKVVNDSEDFEPLKVITYRNEAAGHLIDDWLFNLNHQAKKQDRSCHCVCFHNEEGEHYLAIAVNKIFIGGNGLTILMQQLTTAAEPIASIDPNDYLKAEQNLRQDKRYQQTLRYWSSKIKNEAFSLPAVQSNSASFFSSYQRYDLPAASRKKIIELSQRYQVSSLLVIDTLLQIYLSCCADKENTILGYANQHYLQSERELQTIGNFLQYLLMKNSVSAQSTLIDCLKKNQQERARDDYFSAISHRQVIVELRKHYLMPNQITNVVIEHSRCLPKKLHCDIGEFSRIDTRCYYAATEGLTIRRSEEKGQIGLSFHADKKVATYLPILIDCFEHIAQQLLEQPEQAISQLSLLPQKYYQQIYQQWHRQGEAVDPQASVHARLEQWAEKTPHQFALRDSKNRLSYQQLNQRANQYARLLQQQVGEKKSPLLIALYLSRRVDALAILFATLKLGGAYVFIDTDYPDARVKYIIENSQAAMVICEDKKAVVQFSTFMPSQAIINIDEKETQEKLAQQDSRNLDKKITGHQLAYLVYTSGTTGHPKGVMISHHNILNQHYATAELLDKKQKPTVYGLLLSFAFDGMGTDTWQALMSGKELVILNREEFLTPQALQKSINHYQIEHSSVPVALINHYGLEQPGCFSQMKVLSCGGEKPNAKALLAIKNHHPKITFINYYGPSEATVSTTAAIIEPQSQDFDKVPIGQPQASYQCYVVNRHNRLLPPGTPGELLIGGPALSFGYWQLPEKTTEVFIDDPFNQLNKTANKLYRSGDKVRWLSSGQLEFIERIDTQVKVRGFRIELSELEHCLNNMAGLRQAAALLDKDESNQESSLLAFVCRENTHLTREEILNELSKTLPNFMLPSKLLFLEQMPYTLNGKINKQALLEQVKKQQSKEKRSEKLNETEQKLAAILEKILKRKISISSCDDIFSLGVHSLIVSRFVVQIQKYFSQQLAIKEIFSLKTLQLIAQRIENLQGKETAPALLLQKNTSNRSKPLDLQETFYFVAAKNKNGSENVVLNIEFNGKINPSLLKNALAALAERHQAFRTYFSTENGSLEQLVTTSANLAIETINISQLDVIQRYQEILAQINQIKFFQFDLSQAPLAKFVILIESTAKIHLLCSFFHGIYDGTSQTLFTDDLAACYRALEQNKALPAWQQDFEFSDYCYSYTNWQENNVLQPHQAYWQNVAAKSQATLLKFVKNNHEELFYPDTISYKRSLNQEERKLLLDFSSSHGLSNYAIFFSALYLYLHRYLQQEKLLIKTIVANRNHTELDNSIGCFINALFLHQEIQQEDTLLSYSHRLYQDSLQMFDYQALGYNDILKAFNCTEKEICNVMFSYQANIAFSDDFTENSHYRIDEINPGPTDEITLLVEEHDDGIIYQFRFDPNIISKKQLEQFTTAYHFVLRSLLTNPQQSALFLAIQSTEERQYFINQSSTQLAQPLERTFFDLFLPAAKRQKNSIALIHNQEQISYEQLRVQSLQLAYYIRTHCKLEQGPYRFALVHMKKSIPAIITLLALWRLGYAYIVLDPDQPPARLKYIADNAEAKLLISDQANQHDFDCAMTLNWSDIIADVEKQAQKEFPVNCRADDYCYMIYTSGSTGNPKGTLVQHQAIYDHIYYEQEFFNLTQAQVYSCCHSLAFDFSVKEIFHALAYGHRCVLVDKKILLHSEQLVELIEREQVSFFCQTPSSFINFAEAAHSQGLAHTPKIIYLAGENLNLDSLNPWFDATHSQGSQIYNAYGLTETVVVSSIRAISLANIKETLYSPIGKPLNDQSYYILDNYLNPTPPGIIGELYIGGNRLSAGYWKNQALTNERFLIDPFTDKANALMYKTGDLVIRDEFGEFYYVGRCDSQINFRGLRIELGEIESLLSSHFSVNQAAISTQEINGQMHIVAYLTLSNQLANTAKDSLDEHFKAHLKEKLPDYMIPTFYQVLEKIPLTSNGKVDLKALPRMTQTVKYQAAKTAQEKYLVTVWADVLKIEAEQISTQATFYQLGGTSLQVARMLYRLRQEPSNAKLNLNNLPSHLTIHNLANRQTAADEKEILAQAQKEALLKESWQVIHPLSTKINTILLTGSTGFLGIYLLANYLKKTTAHIVCAVRGENGLARQKAVWQHYFPHQPWQADRITIVSMDLAATRCGLSDKDWDFLARSIDLIVHNGALVHHIYDYEKLKASNVDSTNTLLTLAIEGKSKRFVFISTASAVSEIKNNHLMESGPSQDFNQINGYLLSKYVSERLVWQAGQKGLAVQIMRPGNISADRKTAAMDASKNHLLFFIKGCIQMGFAPSSTPLFSTIDFSPVDEVSDIISALTENISANHPAAFHLVNPKTVALTTLWHWLGSLNYSITVLPYSKWQKKLNDIDERNALFPLMQHYLAHHQEAEEIKIDFSYSEQIKRKEFSLTEKTYFIQLIKKLESIGFLTQ